MAKVTVDFYEKTLSYCPSCISMKSTLRQWEEEHPDEALSINFLSAEEHVDEIRQHGKSAPIVRVKRGRDESWVSGNNPDAFVDMLNGDSSLWDDI